MTATGETLNQAPVLHLNIQNTAASAGRIPGLDGLRAVSICIVIIGHYFVRSNLGFAALGVYLFFAISGFLITRLLFLELKRTGSISIANFYGRRVRRLYPVLIFYTLVMAAFFIFSGREISFVEISSVFLYFVNYLESWNAIHGGNMEFPVGVLWSLSVEEHFYVFMPIFFLIFKGRTNAMLWFSFLLIVLPLSIRIGYYCFQPEIIGKLITYRNSETRFDSIAIGVMLAILCEIPTCKIYIETLSNKWIFFVSIALFVIVAMIPGVFYRETIRFSLISLCCIPIICGVIFGKNITNIQKLLNSSLVKWIGVLSYSLYVWHGGMGYFVDYSGLRPNGLFSGVLKLVLLLPLASASYYFVERPALRLKIANWPRRPSPEEARSPS